MAGELTGAGLGLRRAHLGPFLSEVPAEVDFLEVAPENWIRVGGRLRDAFEAIAPRRPLACHGLSLNLGGLDPIDEPFVRELGRFLDEHDVVEYGDHLTFSGHEGHFYELLPIPFTAGAVARVADRINRVQDLLGRRITIENASYYCAPGQRLSETEFLNGVLEAADCRLLLDVNNVYVNHVNHAAYDPATFIASLDTDRIAYLHIAGHERVADDLAIDTHGEPVPDPVYEILRETYRRHGVLPTLLERDVNLPPIEESLAEMAAIRAIQAEFIPAVATAV